jgi:dTDP-L-rhamnose 4-epimerase
MSSKNSTFKKILVTGGAGFIGSFIVDELINQGYKVVILDSLDKQVHQQQLPKYLNKKAQFIQGDVTKKADIKKALEGVDAIYHEASVVGVGQSMYQIDRYVYNNTQGTARLLDYLANNQHSVRRIIVASSMSAYGEGLYQCPKCGPVRPQLRPDHQMEKHDWEPRCLNCNQSLSPIPTPETERFSANTVYSLTKQTQEELVMMFGRAYKIPTTALRYFNVYGPRQSLSNPYTGVTAIFLSRLKNDQPPIIYEDGLQSRDFISVYDIAKANLAVLENPNAFNQIFNLGGGKPVAIKDIATILAKLTGKNIAPNITGGFRSGDVRHCIADISKAKKLLKWQPEISFSQGVADLISWGEKETAVDNFLKAQKKMKQKGLL